MYLYIYVRELIGLYITHLFHVVIKINIFKSSV